MLVHKNEAIKVKTKCFWVIDKGGKVLLEYHMNVDDARKALAKRENDDREAGYYEEAFYKVVRDDIGSLMKKGFKLEFF